MSSPTQPEPVHVEYDVVLTDEPIRRQAVKPFRSLDDLLGWAPRADQFGSYEQDAFLDRLLHLTPRLDVSVVVLDTDAESNLLRR